MKGEPSRSGNPTAGRQNIMKINSLSGAFAGCPKSIVACSLFFNANLAKHIL